MRNTIVLEVKDVFLTDFDSKLSAPLFIESMEGGVRILFDDIDELRSYKESLLSGEDQTEEGVQGNDVKSKLNVSLDKALLDNQIVLESIKAFAGKLFSFIFTAEAHKQDKIEIFDAMVEGVRETTDSSELAQAINVATFELGHLVLSRRLTFYNFAHNQADFNYEKIKNRLVKELLILKLQFGN